MTSLNEVALRLCVREGVALEDIALRLQNALPDLRTLEFTLLDLTDNERVDRPHDLGDVAFFINRKYVGEYAKFTVGNSASLKLGIYRRMPSVYDYGFYASI
eukprot:gene24704-30071_t